MVHAAGVGNVTHLLGLRNDIPHLMAGLTMLVSSSSYGEAFPNVIGEAMACGIPCVVTDVGESAYIVGDTGKVVAAYDIEGLAVAMESFLTLTENERNVLGMRARARVEKNFDIEAVVRMYESFYKELFDGQV